MIHILPDPRLEKALIGLFLAVAATFIGLSIYIVSGLFGARRVEAAHEYPEPNEEEFNSQE